MLILPYITLAISAPAASNVDQLVIVKIEEKTTAEIAYTPGDRVAHLRMRHPPASILETFRQQRGAALTDASYVSSEGEKLHLMLHLASTRYVPEMKIQRRRNLLTIGLRYGRRIVSPRAADLLGHVATYAVPPELPTIVPKVRRPAECDARAIERMQGRDSERKARLRTEECDDFEVARRIARLLLVSQKDTAKSSRWAFRLTSKPEWSHSPTAYYYTRIVAALALERSEIYPEAATLVDTYGQPKSAPLWPYRRYVEARVLFREEKYDRALAAFRELKSAKSKSVRNAAWTGRVLCHHFLGAHDKVVALNKEPPKGHRGSARPWLLIGESALKIDDLVAARTAFESATGIGTKRSRAYAAIRLGDVAVRTRPETKRPYAHVPDNTDSECLDAMLKLRVDILDALKESPDSLEQRLERHLNMPRCDAVALEATFALAQTYLAAGIEAEALRISDRLPPRLAQRMASRLGLLFIRRLTRHHDWARLAKVTQARLSDEASTYPPEVVLEVARAYLRLGLPAHASDLLVRLLRTTSGKSKELEISLCLAAAYLMEGDDLRADIVFSFLAKRPDYLKDWRTEHLSIIHRTHQDPDFEPVPRLRALWGRVASGDPKVTVGITLASALLRAEKYEEAGELTTALLRQPYAGAQVPPQIATEALSACLSRCRKQTLETLFTTVQRVHPQCITDRILAWARPNERPQIASRAPATGPSFWRETRAYAEPLAVSTSSITWRHLP